MKTLVLTVAAVCCAATATASAQARTKSQAQGFPHPLYLHGLQDLKQAERSWYAAPAPVRTSRHGRAALQHINAAQNIILQVAGAEHMDAKALPPADARPPSGEGALADTQKYLQQALSDVSQKETDSKFERSRLRAISEVRAAIYEAKAAGAQSVPGAPSAAGPAAPTPGSVTPAPGRAHPQR